MRAAAVQLTATEDTARNLAAADRLVREAAAQGAQLAVLPEKWTVLGSDVAMDAAAEPLDGPALTWARGVAREFRIDLVAGSIVERRAGHERHGNTSVHVDPDGEVRAVYRKIHLFDVEVGGRLYRESDTDEPGEEIVLTELAGGVPLGMMVCYDVRFPELSRILAVRGARVLAVPAAEAQRASDDLVAAGVKILFNYSEALLDTPPDVAVHTSNPAVELLYALYFHLT